MMLIIDCTFLMMLIIACIFNLLLDSVYIYLYFFSCNFIVIVRCCILHLPLNFIVTCCEHGACSNFRGARCKLCDFCCLFVNCLYRFFLYCIVYQLGFSSVRGDLGYGWCSSFSSFIKMYCLISWNLVISGARVWLLWFNYNFIVRFYVVYWSYVILFSSLFRM